MLDTKARWFYAGRLGWFSILTPFLFNVYRAQNSLKFFFTGAGTMTIPEFSVVWKTSFES